MGEFMAWGVFEVWLGLFWGMFLVISPNKTPQPNQTPNKMPQPNQTPNKTSQPNQTP